MSTGTTMTYRTDFRVWAIVFLIMAIPAGFYEMYPDQRLWMAFLLSPLMAVQGLVSRDTIVVGHLALLAAAFWILLGSSWVLHCIIIWLWKIRSSKRHGT